MTPEISLPKEAKKIYSYDTLTEHMWFLFYKMLFCRQRNNLTTTGRTLAYIFIIKKTDNGRDRKSTRLNSSHKTESRMPSSA